jgi:DNA-directed RNA polymerase specialized sigma24 family protein
MANRQPRYVAPALRRETVISKFGGGMTVRDIAEELGITTQAVYRHLHLAGIRLSTPAGQREASA